MILTETVSNVLPKVLENAAGYHRASKIHGNLRIDQAEAKCVRWELRRMQLDDNLKQLIKELGAAINDALSESDEIGEAIQNVRSAGYDVFLVLEATIGFNRRKGDSEETLNGLKSGEMKLKVTAQDLKFLRSLKISVEDLDQPQ